MTSADPPAPVRIRILEAPGAGDNRQLDALADAIASRVGARIQRRAGLPALGTVIAGRLARALGLRRPGRPASARESPDLVLIAGGRSVDEALIIREHSGGRCRVMCLGRPWAPLGWFDRVITTPQYRLPDHPAVVNNLLPLDQPRTRDTAVPRQQSWPDIPSPRLGMLVGGPSGSYRYAGAIARRLAKTADDWHAATGGGVLLSGSARTPEGLIESVAGITTAPCAAHPWRPGDPDNPYPAILARADAFTVTADSASMLADALRQQRPTALVDIPERLRPRLLRWLRASNGMRAKIRDRLVTRGLWFPARDLPGLHAELMDRGALVRDVGALRADAPRPADLTREDMERAVAAVAETLRP